MFRALILDWSGTLVDDMEPTLAATNAVLERFEKPPMTREEFRMTFRLPYTDFYDEHLPGVPIEVLEEHFREAFDASSHPVTPLEGAAEFLAWCRLAGIRLFVLTSMNPANFEKQTREFGFVGFFEQTYSGVIDKRPVLLEILRTHALRSEETAYVGDMAHDIETAHHGGVTPVGVLSGYDPRSRLEAARPALLLSCVKSLHAVLAHARDRMGSAPPGGDRIIIRRLAVETTIGVPDEERGSPQRLFVTVRMEPERPFRSMDDRIEQTIDYDALACRVRALAAERPRHLIETLANEIADCILSEYGAREVEVEVEKHILPDTEAVLVRTWKRRGDLFPRRDE